MVFVWIALALVAIVLVVLVVALVDNDNKLYDIYVKDCEDNKATHLKFCELKEEPERTYCIDDANTEYGLCMESAELRSMFN